MVEVGSVEREKARERMWFLYRSSIYLSLQQQALERLGMDQLIYNYLEVKQSFLIKIRCIWYLFELQNRIIQSVLLLGHMSGRCLDNINLSF